MTCIAYTKGVLAADSRATDTTGTVYKSKKIEELPNGTVVGTAGDADAREVLALLGRATKSKMPSKASLIKTQTTFDGIWIFPDGVIYFVSVGETEGKWSAEIRESLDGWAAVGSGAHYAIGAILAGKSAIEAVKIACRLDANCGLPIQSIKLERTE